MLRLLVVNNEFRFLVRESVAVENLFSNTNIPAGNRFKFAIKFVFQTNSCIGYLNGNALNPQTLTLSIPNNSNNITLGALSSFIFHLNDSIYQVSFSVKEYTNAELQQLTTL